jgi:predicted SAM-dependent methyltransferase
MSRIERILKHISKEQLGIEVGGWFAPLASRKDGYNCLTLDVFDQETLIKNAKADSSIDDATIPNIQQVDLLGTSTEIEQLVAFRNELGQFDYIVSSHNFEHLPNPIKFLKGCGKVLKQGGVLSLAIPDRRVCFDIYKSGTSLGQWIDAHMDDRVQPTQAQVFDNSSMMAHYQPKRPYQSPLRGKLEECYLNWVNNNLKSNTPYQDAHCWAFTPASFELLIRDAYFLNLSPLSVLEITARPKGNEFYVHLKNTGYNKDSTRPISAKDNDIKRQQLLTRTVLEPRYLMSLKNRLSSFF